MILKRQSTVSPISLVGFLLLLLFSISACAEGSLINEDAASEPDDGMELPPGSLSVADTVDQIAHDPDNFAGQMIDIVAYVNAPESRNSDPTAPPRGCPAFLERMPTLTDEPFAGEFQVAGVMLPTPLPDDMASLQLVIPLGLGILEVPPYAHLRGRVLDPEYTGCPESEQLFILEEVLNALPQDIDGETERSRREAAVAEWEPWEDESLGLGLKYPQGWQIEESRNVGSVFSARFTTPDGARIIRLTVLGDKTYWNPADGSSPPAPLAGERQLLVTAGEADARLVDAPASPTESTPLREIRLVLNYNEQTLIFLTRFRQDEPPDLALIDAFSQMVTTIHFDHDLGVTDPLDPMVTSHAELGNGPFIDQATAEQAALTASGMLQRTVIDARLVPELEARNATTGSCRDFQERPEAVWLVTVRGVIPAGQEAERLVYIDAVTSRSLCQAEVPVTSSFDLTQA